MFSQNYSCPEHNISIDELSPRMFSFNNPFGACEKCTGLGTFLKVDPDLVIPDKKLSIRQGAIKASGWYFSDGGIAQMYYEGLAKHYDFSLDTPVRQLPKKIMDILLYGTKGEKIKLQREKGLSQSTYFTDFEGIVNNLERRFRESNSEWMREEISLCAQGEPEAVARRLAEAARRQNGLPGDDITVTVMRLCPVD